MLKDVKKMSQQQYLIRLDDACPTMNHSKWKRMEGILERYGIKPLVGVIPHNEDQAQQIDPADEAFWDHVKAWKQKGWTIAMHGYNHVYSSEDPGINPFWHRSEFAGLPLEEQREKIRKGVGLLKEHGIEPRYFFAPSHTFDGNTIIALKKESDIRIICDTVGRYPYYNDGIWFIPQFLGHCIEMPFGGYYSFCFHPNTMIENDFARLDSFIRSKRDRFISFNDISLEVYSKRFLSDIFLEKIFFLYRKLRGRR